MKVPWEIRPELTPEKLDMIGEAIASARDEVAVLRMSDNGDNAWAHGCRAYVWAGTALEKLSATQPWLYARMNLNKFTGRIGELPFTISRDDPDEVCDRTKNKISRLPDHEYNIQGDFGFEHVWSDSQARFCFVIDATADEVFGVSCLGVLNNGVIVARYDTDLYSSVKTLKDTDPPDNTPHEVPEFNPSFKVDGDKADSTINDNNDAGRLNEKNDVDGGTS